MVAFHKFSRKKTAHERHVPIPTLSSSPRELVPSRCVTNGILVKKRLVVLFVLGK